VANNSTSTFSSDVSLYIAQKVLQVALKNLVLYGLCDKAPLPKNSGRTFQYTRYERVVLPQSALSEGVTPGDTAMSISTVSAVMDQWGAVIPLTDQAIDSIKHPVLQKAMELAGMQAAEALDREIALTLLAGTNVFYPNAHHGARFAHDL
jgi:N4-gp56 family major capsid protein